MAATTSSRTCCASSTEFYFRLHRARQGSHGVCWHGAGSRAQPQIQQVSPEICCTPMATGHSHCGKRQAGSDPSTASQITASDQTAKSGSRCTEFLLTGGPAAALRADSLMPQHKCFCSEV